ncbi:cobalt-zinc-cadmium efflux system protein [Parabacteroides sp. PFB2-12]|uniref:cation diffusion facilitator family transporter n=1 Tax=unclassified Parabacteroides TaxID=2649774 RepID=UPI0024747801|nr:MULTISPECIES: cation diffusion facilitator family transporter [unclassified Parabacteroides]MDH6341813.1 cobalt-zinc-cadmium efflux system protein [Parabacteroides sp. PM6-13]MDH6391648.1 cobalt-zinc-cadmium efflux system protein [Parabacteroides sp. PFB2-12]
MGHHHTHGAEQTPHHDHHHHEITSLNRAFIISISLNIAFVLAEFAAGFWYDSLGLLSDAGHNLSDVASLILAMLAFRLAKVNPTPNYTYGLKKSTILVSLLNAVILLIAVGIIISESIDKFFHPQPVEGGAIAWVAGIGVVINGLTAWLFMKDKDKDLNVKGAYLHMAADALVSIGVVISGIIIIYTGWYIVDPIIGLVIAGVIVYSTWGLLRDSLRLSLDGVPAGTDIRDIEKTIRSVVGVQDLHHLHVWGISTTETALTVHVVVENTDRMEEIKEEIKQALRHIGVQHVTLEFELSSAHCHGDCGEILSKD